jgi:hypothetical protein
LLIWGPVHTDSAVEGIVDMAAGSRRTPGKGFVDMDNFDNGMVLAEDKTVVVHLFGTPLIHLIQYLACNTASSSLVIITYCYRYIPTRQKGVG